MKALLFIFLTSVALSSTALAAGSSKVSPLNAGTSTAMVCPKNAMCAPLATVPPIIPPPWHCPPWAMCVPLPKGR